MQAESVLVPGSSPLAAEVRSGAMPAVVMLHGVFMDRSLWGEVAGRLSSRMQLLVDGPGHGRSGKTGAGTTLHDHVRQVEETMLGHGITGAVIAGHSWGGMIALRLARRRPDLVAGLVLTNTPMVRTSGARRLGFLAQVALLRGGIPLSIYAAAAVGSLYGGEHRAAHRQLAAEMTERMRRMGRGELARTIHSVILDPPDGVDLALGLDVPLRVLAGEEDYVLGEGVRERLAAGCVDVRVIPGGHMSPVEAPGQVAEAIEAIAAQAAQRTASPTPRRP